MPAPSWNALALGLAALTSAVNAQDLGFETTGSESFYWHGRYHGLIAMAAYANDTTAVCKQTFTEESMRTNFPETTATDTFEIVNTWGPTEKYGLSGFEVIVPEMNKILSVISDVYGWQEYSAALVPFEGIDCDECMVHQGAYEAFREIQNVTNNWEVLQRRQGDYVWSSAGYGFGGMVAQAAALELKHREMLWSIKTFGSPPVFNAAAADMYNNLIVSDASQRYVYGNDSVPGMIPVGEGSDYVFVNTGVHIFGSSPMYGLDYNVCYDPTDPECHGGDNEADHYFYFTDIGHCGENGYDTQHNDSVNAMALSSVASVYEETATVSSFPETPDLSASATPTDASSSAISASASISISGLSSGPALASSSSSSAAAAADDDALNHNAEVSAEASERAEDSDSSAAAPGFTSSTAMLVSGVLGALSFCA